MFNLGGCHGLQTLTATELLLHCSSSTTPCLGSRLAAVGRRKMSWRQTWRPMRSRAKASRQRLGAQGTTGPQGRLAEAGAAARGMGGEGGAGDLAVGAVGAGAAVGEAKPSAHIRRQRACGVASVGQWRCAQATGVSPLPDGCKQAQSDLAEAAAANHAPAALDTGQHAAGQNERQRISC